VPTSNHLNMAHPMLVLLAEGEAHESPQAVSRRSLSSSQQYNSSADARDTGLVTAQTNDEKRLPPQLAYNASNDEQGLLLFGLSPLPETESGADDEEEELVASDAKLEQNNFEDVENAFAELIATTTTTATSHIDLVGSMSTPTSSRPPYMFACDNYSNEDRYDSNSNKGSLTIEKHVVLFGYDLLIASQQQTSIDGVSSMIHEFETRLLEQVGSELLKSTVETNLLCDRSNSSGDELQTASGRERKGSQGGMSVRGGHRQVLESHLPKPIQLSRLSSLPADKISNGECNMKHEYAQLR
jgi:hypothetical protein